MTAIVVVSGELFGAPVGAASGSMPGAIGNAVGACARHVYMPSAECISIGLPAWWWWCMAEELMWCGEGSMAWPMDGSAPVELGRQLLLEERLPEGSSGGGGVASRAAAMGVCVASSCAVVLSSLPSAPSTWRSSSTLCAKKHVERRQVEPR